MKKLLCGLISVVLGVTLLQGAPPSSAKAGEVGRAPAVQTMKSVPVRVVKAKSSRVTAGSVTFRPETMPPVRKNARTVNFGRGWSKQVDGLTLRSSKSDGAHRAAVRLAAIGDGVTVPRGPIFELSTLSSTPTPPARDTGGPTTSPSAAPSEVAGSYASRSSGKTASQAATPQPGDSSDPATAPNEPTGPLPAQTKLRLDYSAFANAFGGDWAGRLQLVLLEGCTTTSGTLRCKSSKPLQSHADAKTETVTATLPARRASNQSTMVAATASSAGPQGDYGASPLAPSSSWSAGQQSGDFNWSYSLGTPPGINGPTPSLALGYSSGAVDGRTSTSNAQASWVGEGFDLDPGFIERSFKPCLFVSGTPEYVGDLCWRDDHLAISLNGKSSPLVRKGDSDEWRMKTDDGTKVERLYNASNRDNNGEHWRVTTTDGTEYYYGLSKRPGDTAATTDSVSTVPVYGATSGNECHESTYANSVCSQAWRWGLDYVRDPNGNTMSYFWDQEKNNYGSNKNEKVRTYDRASVLKSIEYGTREGLDAPAPARVVFSTAERCIPTTDFSCAEDKLTEDNASHWPDVPFDQICKSDSSCANRTTPTFFTRKRLAKVTTQVLRGTTYASVNEWSLQHQLPATGDVSSDPDKPSRVVRSLWLSQIQQTGKVGDDVTLPAIKFGRELKDNRVFDHDGIDSFARFRVNAIDNGTGGTIGIRYSEAGCTPSSKPAESELDSNARRCFPVWLRVPGSGPDEKRKLEFFHKYRVESISESEGTSASAISQAKITSYSYSGGDGWHFTSSRLDESDYRTWDDWRGYAEVTTQVGNSSTKTYSSTTYFRGMDGDEKIGGGKKSVTVDGVVDREQWAGMPRRTTRRLGATGNVVDIAISTPWTSPTPTAVSANERAYQVGVSASELRTRLANNTYRITKTATTFDNRGRASQIHEAGVESDTSDDQCTTTEYADNEAEWLLSYPATVTVIGRPCGQEPQQETDVISASKTAYDGRAAGSAPTRGNVTESFSASGLSNGKLSYRSDARTTFDPYGRVIVVEDAKGRKTSTAYEPETGYPTSEKVTNAKGQSATNTLESAWGAARSVTDIAGGVTSIDYDALGRVTAVWEPDRDKAAGTSPSRKYGYRVSTTSTNTVSTEQLNAAGDYVKSVDFYDGFLRERATQDPSPGVNGGRVITEKWYDDRGWLVYEQGPYYNDGQVGTALTTAAESEIPRSTRYTYDAVGRVTEEMLLNIGQEKWATKRAYDGDQVRTTAPTGGTSTTEAFDARGRLTSLTQHTGATPTGGGDVTSYTYTPAGSLATVKNASGEKWTKSYNVRGELIVDEDPDKGKTTSTYDLVGELETQTDARGVTLKYAYDALDRKTSIVDVTKGQERAKWSYDSPRVGSLSTSTRVEDGQEWKTEINSYDAAGRVTKSTFRVPASVKELYRSGGYPVSTAYNPDGSVQSQTQPTVGDITNETLRYTYDGLGNMKTFKGAVTIVSDVIYSPLGEVLQRTSGNVANNSVYDTRYYDEATRRETRRSVGLQGSATTPVLDLNTTHDQAGNVRRLDDLATGDVWRQCFTYDYLRRMRAAWSTSTTNCAAATTSTLGSTAPYSDSFDLAPNGNRRAVVSMRKPDSSVVSTTRTSKFEASTGQPHAVSSVVATGASSGTQTLTYDKTGNLLEQASGSSKKIWTWDPENRVESVSATGGNKVDYLYDADGNRMLEEETIAAANGNPASTTLTFYLGASKIKVTKGTTAGTNTTTTRTYSIDGEPVGTRSNVGIRLTMSDANGTPLVSVNPNNLQVTKRRQTPFGEDLQTTPSGSSWPTNRGFLNKMKDGWTGTTHLEAREYEPSGGRFISVDPIADYMDPQQLNGYAYANNSPVTMTDPDGLRTECGGCGGDWNSPVAGDYNYDGTKKTGSGGGGSGSAGSNPYYNPRNHPNFNTASRFTALYLNRLREQRDRLAQLGFMTDKALSVVGAADSALGSTPSERVAVQMQISRNVAVALYGTMLLTRPADALGRASYARSFFGYSPKHRSPSKLGAARARGFKIFGSAFKKAPVIAFGVTTYNKYGEQSRMDAARSDLNGLEKFVRASSRGLVVATAQSAAGAGYVAVLGAPAVASCPETLCVSVALLAAGSWAASEGGGKAADEVMDGILN